MFLESSRYHRLQQVEATDASGRRAAAVKLRRLPTISGNPTGIKQNDRLDIMAQRLYDNPTMFWRIADANSELQARDLTREVGRIIYVPEQ